MKKIIFILTLIFISMCAFCEVYTLQNDLMKLDITVEKNNNTYISSIVDLKTGQEFISKDFTDCFLWSFTLKNDEVTSGPIVGKLLPFNAKSLDANLKNNVLTLVYNNINAGNLNEDYTVKCIVKLVGNNTYWNMSISEGKTHGFWEVRYPIIKRLDTQNGDNFMIPGRGDTFLTEYDNPKGFRDPAKDDDNAIVTHYDYFYPKCLQYTSLTKGKSTLYMSPEDTYVTYKTMNWDMDKPNTMSIYPSYFPPYMAQAGHEYKQLNTSNISVFPGDWFDAAKKYRKWGIKVNYAPFSQGKMEFRKDLPDWWKRLNACFNWNRTEQAYLFNNLIKLIKKTEGPILVHLYQWNDRVYDTCYPNWLPMKEGQVELNNIIKNTRKDVYLMPYTNGHLVDLNLSPYAQKYGDIMAKKDLNGAVQEESWAVGSGCKDAQACTRSVYMDCYLNEYKEIIKLYPYDAFYVDQVGASSSILCFDKRHDHPQGGGTFIQEDYMKMLNEMRNITKEVYGKTIPITTEDGGDAFTFDGWLKVNEGPWKSENNPVRTVIYSGYVSNFGDDLKDCDFNDWSIAQKFSSQLTKGYQLGWSGPQLDRFWRAKLGSQYVVDLINARNLAVEYFNLGEMTRDINITSNIPTMNVTWGHFSNPNGIKKDVRTIKSCTFNYHNKSMICITNCGDKDTLVEWNTNNKNLYLKDKSSYKISQIYPNKKFISKGKDIKGSITVPSLSTVIYIVE